VPPDQRERFLRWIDENGGLRKEHGILLELVLARSPRQNPEKAPRPRDVDVEEEELLVLTAWPDHDRLTVSPTHEAVQFQPLTRYDVIGGYLADALPDDPTGGTS
jgi:hypothetical protein